MGRIFFILIAIGAFLTWRRWRKLKTQQERRDFIYKGLVFGLVLLVIGLAIFGRIDVLGAVFATLLLSIKYILAFAIRHFPIIARIYGATDGFGLGKKRTLKTEWVEFSVDFSSKKLNGRVLQGEFAETSLDDLSQPDVEKLLAACSADQKTSYLLKTYIHQRFKTGTSDHQSQSSGAMSREEALEILGLEGNPTEKDIKLAHKQLMQKLHPDRGGNDFLASLINRARDQLINK